MNAAAHDAKAVPDDSAVQDAGAPHDTADDADVLEQPTDPNRDEQTYEQRVADPDDPDAMTVAGEGLEPESSADEHADNPNPDADGTGGTGPTGATAAREAARGSSDTAGPGGSGA
ncbi:hypothetical protein [Herbiconiux sp.]|uniref:hypothetical protein n=1 Tax=Herbiconiux sp. TaxID=1871186 RepID=UPI0025BA89EF|nr:hypothetical protein [Herbiconiux sp.]